MKVLTIITSYNRKQSLESILSILDKQETDIIIYDDCSDFQLDRPDYVKLPFNYGKEYLWLKFKKIFNEIPKDYDYYIILPDDVYINDDFIKNTVNLWCKLPDKNKICLSLFSDLRCTKPNWTNFEPIKQHEYIQTQWTDFYFICEKEFFTVEIQPISLKRWVILQKQLNMLLGSGLGGQISRYWHNKGKTMYHLVNGTASHKKGISMMNYEERLKNPL